MNVALLSHEGFPGKTCCRVLGSARMCVAAIANRRHVVSCCITGLEAPVRIQAIPYINQDHSSRIIHIISYIHIYICTYIYIYIYY